jgi:hypothetical protein
MKSITQENIALIRAICNKNGITFYDVQLEAIDHIASMVEHRWELFPNEDFITALDAVILHVDWCPFRYKHDYYIYNHNTWNLYNMNKDDKKLLIIFLCTAIVFSILFFFDVGMGVYNDIIYFIFLTLSCVLCAVSIGIACWVAYKLNKANYYLSTLYKGKYIFGIFFSLFLALIVGANISIILKSVYHKTVFSLLMSGFQFVYPFMLLYRMIIKPIIKAQKQYPSLYKS